MTGRFVPWCKIVGSLTVPRRRQNGAAFRTPDKGHFILTAEQFSAFRQASWSIAIVSIVGICPGSRAHFVIAERKLLFCVLLFVARQTAEMQSEK
jgi:hypothetical protein